VCINVFQAIFAFPKITFWGETASSMESLYCTAENISRAVWCFLYIYTILLNFQNLQLSYKTKPVLRYISLLFCNIAYLDCCVLCYLPFKLFIVGLYTFRSWPFTLTNIAIKSNVTATSLPNIHLHFRLCFTSYNIEEITDMYIKHVMDTQCLTEMCPQYQTSHTEP
jgi:hypothetical protein